MAEFTLAEIAQATGGEILQKGSLESFPDVVTDTRKITPKCVFVALKGEKFDGHDFAVQAAEKGAACVMVNRAVTVKDVAAVQVEDTLNAYQRLAAYHRRRFSIPVVAVTGSNGKTTTKDLTAAVLSEKYTTLKTEANFNNEIGLPRTLLQLTPQHQAAVVEMGMRGLGQIKHMASLAMPTLAIVTNVGETHMELLGSIENIARAKCELVEAARDGVVILNADDERVKSMRSKVRGRALLFGYGKDADVRAIKINAQGEKTQFDCLLCGERAHFTLPLAGRHNVYNALAAAAAGVALGLNAEQIGRGLSHAAMTDMRLSIGKLRGYTIINDAYNASPASMRSALDVLCDVAKERKIAVLGDMLELGETAAAAHESIGRQAAEKKLDAVVTCGELAGKIAQCAKEGGVPYVFAAQDHAQAAEKLRAFLHGGDTILFKGSRGMRMEKLIELI